MSDIIIVPGFGGSDQDHWQSRWQAVEPEMRRINPSNWDKPDLSDWMAALDDVVRSANTPPILVAHSLGCLLIAHWQAASKLPTAGAFLVAVPDPESDVYPRLADGFANAPDQTIRFPTMIIASENDPFATLRYSQSLADKWGSGLLMAGAHGHIGSSSDVGEWQQGKDLLVAFSAGTRRQSDPERRSTGSLSPSA